MKLKDYLMKQQDSMLINSNIDVSYQKTLTKEQAYELIKKGVNVKQKDSEYYYNVREMFDDKDIQKMLLFTQLKNINETKKHIETIKNIMIFFAVLTIIGVIVSVIVGFNTAKTINDITKALMLLK